MSQRCSYLHLLVWSAAVIGCGSLDAQTLYTVHDLGELMDLTGQNTSGPYAISSAGAIAGANLTNGYYQAMLYNGTWTELGTLGGTESFAAGLNDLGQVVGFSQTAEGGTNAFLWSAGQMSSLGTLGGPVSEAFSINHNGQVTGYSDVPARPTTQQHAFVFSAGNMVDIGSGIPGLPNSFGYGINASGHVAGTAYDAAYSAPRAFFFDGTNSTDLGVLGGMGASALALNDSDNLVGYLTTTDMVDRAFSYRGGTATDLGTLGGNYSYALALNNSNVIVGGSFVDAKNSIYHAFVWRDGAMQDLNKQLDSSGSGWTLVEARAINDAGQITGVGSIGGVNHGFLLSLATPATNVAPQVTLTLGNASVILVQFPTVSGQQYVLQTNSTLAVTNWADASPALTGTGDTVYITNSAPAADSVFYRVKLSGP